MKTTIRPVPAVRIQRGQAQPVKQSNHQLSLERFLKLVEKITGGIKETATQSSKLNHGSQFAAVMFDRGNDASFHLYGAGFRVSIEMVETNSQKGAQS